MSARATLSASMPRWSRRSKPKMPASSSISIRRKPITACSGNNPVSEALYHKALVERARSAFGKGRLPDATSSATVDNPLCGDRVTLDLAVKDGHIAAISHHVRGCLLCEAAAATIAEYCRGSSKEELEAISAAARKLMAEGGPLAAGQECLEI